MPSSLHLKITVSKRIFCIAPSLKSLVRINPVHFHLSAAVDESEAGQKYQENIKHILNELRSVEFAHLSAKYSLKGANSPNKPK